MRPTHTISRPPKLVFSALLLLVALRPLAAQKAEVSLDSKDVVEARLRAVADKNQDREAALEKMFEQVGCSGDRLVRQPVKHVKLPNVVCALPGSVKTVILVGAHFDHVSIGRGAADNWSGASLLPTLYESLQSQPRNHTFIFVGFTAEEQGLIGSGYYARQLTKEQAAGIRAMVNLDTLGLSPTKVWVSHSDRKLVDALGRVAFTLKLPLEGVNADRVARDDAEPFQRLHIPLISIHSVTQETMPILHSARDNLNAIHLDDYYETYRLVAFYLAYLDTLLD